nr:GNAT family N-acetyltransferase [Sphingomicrobium flavum]
MFLDAMQRATAHPLKGERAELLRTERLVLRRARPDDLEPLHAMFTDAETMAHWSTPPHESLEQTRTWLQSMIDGADMPGDDFIIEMDGEVLGKVGPYMLPEFGILVRRDHWEQGIGAEAMHALIDYLRERGVPHLIADIEPDNIGSIRLMEKLGFSWSGSKEKAMMYGDRWADSVYLRLDL